jgi:hypothetical protein
MGRHMWVAAAGRGGSGCGAVGQRGAGEDWREGEEGGCMVGLGGRGLGEEGVCLHVKARRQRGTMGRGRPASVVTPLGGACARRVLEEVASSTPRVS